MPAATAAHVSGRPLSGSGLSLIVMTPPWLVVADHGRLRIPGAGGPSQHARRHAGIAVDLLLPRAQMSVGNPCRHRAILLDPPFPNLLRDERNTSNANSIRRPTILCPA